MSLYKRTLPLAIMGIVVVVGIFEWALNVSGLTTATNELTRWATLIGAVTIVVAAWVLITYHGRILIRERLSKRGSGSLLFFAVFFLYIGTAVAWGGLGSDQYQWLYSTVYGNAASAMWILMLFWGIWAAWIAFRIRTIETLALAVSSIIMIFYQGPIGAAIVPWWGTMAEWLTNTLVLGGVRGGVIALAVGTIIIALRIMVGQERGVLP